MASGDERHVKPVGAKLRDRIAGRAFGNLDLNAGMGFAVSCAQPGEEAAGDQGMDADTKPAALARRCHAFTT